MIVGVLLVSNSLKHNTNECLMDKFAVFLWHNSGMYIMCKQLDLSTRCKQIYGLQWFCSKKIITESGLETKVKVSFDHN